MNAFTGRVEKETLDPWGPPQPFAVQGEELTSSTWSPQVLAVSSSLAACLWGRPWLCSQAEPSGFAHGFVLYLFPFLGTTRSFWAVLFSCFVWVFYLRGFPGVNTSLVSCCQPGVGLPSPCLAPWKDHCCHRVTKYSNWVTASLNLAHFLYLLFRHAGNWRFSVKSRYSENITCEFWSLTAHVVMKWCKAGGRIISGTWRRAGRRQWHHLKGQKPSSSDNIKWAA